MDAPERIWKSIFSAAASGKEPFDGGVGYILATPAALAASPEVQALIREAEARVWQEAKRVTSWSSIVHDLPAFANIDDFAVAVKRALEAAALRKDEETPK